MGDLNKNFTTAPGVQYSSSDFETWMDSMTIKSNTVTLAKMSAQVVDTTYSGTLNTTGALGITVNVPACLTTSTVIVTPLDGANDALVDYKGIPGNGSVLVRIKNTGGVSVGMTNCPIRITVLN